MPEPASKKIAQAEEEKKKRQKPPSALWVRYYKTLLVFMIIAMAVIGWFVVLGPMYGDYQVLDVQAKQEEYNQYRSVLTRFEKIMADWESVSEEDKRRLDYFLPEGKDVPGIVAMLDTMAAQSGFAVTKVSLSHTEQPIEKKPDLFPILISMSIDGGTYQNLKQFVEKIENNLRVLDVESLSFQAGKGIYVLNISTYYLKD